MRLRSEDVPPTLGDTVTGMLVVLCHAPLRWARPPSHINLCSSGAKKQIFGRRRQLTEPTGESLTQTRIVLNPRAVLTAEVMSGCVKGFGCRPNE